MLNEFDSQNALIHQCFVELVTTIDLTSPLKIFVALMLLEQPALCLCYRLLVEFSKLTQDSIVVVAHLNLSYLCTKRT